MQKRDCVLLILLLGFVSMNLNLWSAEFFIIGMGTSPTGDLATIRGKKIIENEVQVLIIPSREMIDENHWGQSIDFKKKFNDENSKDNILICPHNFRFKYGLTPTENAPASFKRIYQGRMALAQKIEEHIKAGHNVAWLQEGDPMVYGDVFLHEMISKEIKTTITPSIGALNAASAALQKNPNYGGDTSAAIITMHDWEGRADLNEELMKNKTNMVIYTMRLNYRDFFNQLGQHYDPETPVAIVFDAGDLIKEEVIISRMGDFMNTIYPNKQNDLESRNNLLYVGKFITGSQARPDGLGSSTKCCGEQ